MNISDLKSYNVVSSSGTIPSVNSTPDAPQSFGSKVEGVAQGISNFVGAKGITDQFGASLARARLPDSQKDFVEEPGLKNVIGSAIQTGASLIPGAGEGLGLLGKTAVGAATGYAFDAGSKLQNNQAPTPGVGTAIGGALPVVGGVASKIVGRLLSGLGSGISGVSAKTIEQIVDNPNAAIKASRMIAQKGKSSVLEENSKTIVNGIANLKKEASQAFGQGLEQLSQKDINPAVYRQNVQTFLDKYGSTLTSGKRTLANIEFDDPKNIAKASGLVDRLSNANLDGKSLRKLSDDIENSKYKTANSDERLSYNRFLNDMSNSLKSAVHSSTDKLGEINKKYSQDVQLAQTMEKEFGKVKFKNMPEVVAASKRLEGLFQKSGLAPERIDDFLTRIGVNKGAFKTSEAVRQIEGEDFGKNTPGTSVGEMMRDVTSAVISPDLIKNLSIVTGLTKEKLNPILKEMKPAARNILINTLLQHSQDSEQNQE